MKKFALIIAAVTLIIIVAGVMLVSKKDSVKSFPLPSNSILYIGNGCPHCKIVEDFLATWEKKDSVKIEQKEVWYNKTNAEEIKARYESCKIPQSEMGVPLLFTPEGKCYSGDQPIIDYLKSI